MAKKLSQAVISSTKRLSFSLFGWPHLLRRIQAPYIVEYGRIEPHHLVLDLGCGGGQLTTLLEGGRLTVGCEVSSAVFHFQSTRTSAAVQGDGFSLPFKDRTFDRVILSSVLQMVDRGPALLAEVSRILTADGKIVLTVPCRYRFLTMAYNSDTFLYWLVRRVCGMPATYDEFQRELMAKFHSKGPGLFLREEIERLIRDADFRIEQWEYAPKVWGTLLYETIVLLKYAAGANISVAGRLPMLLYPLAYLDRFLPKSSVGCELIMRISKAE